ncbi:tyrosine-type recombinase/integrase [Erwinia sp. ACCC 02193]|jgi:integrase|uniref:Tyrosine-type recombinase/integrase n=2 Tax=Erwiniaceae TaxID=1903409 RepID=A0ABV4EDK4_9GAMM
MKAETGTHNIYVPFSRSDYQLNNVLNTEEREALSTGHKRTSALSQQGPLSSLLRPLQDIADRSGASDRLVRIIISAVLAEIHRTGQPCGLWESGKWLALCQQHRSGRPLIAAFAFHLGSFPSPFDLPHHGAPSLYACAIYGREFFTQELNRLTEALVSLGYKRRNQKNQLSALLGILMMMNSNPQLESFTTDLLWRAQKYHDRGIARTVGRVSHALAAMGIIKSPVRMRNYQEWREKPTEDIAQAWVAWCRRWRETSVLRPRSRESQYSFILRCGLWLAREHPEIREPSDWTMEICASFIAAVGRMKVGELSLGTAQGTRRSSRSGEPMLPNSRAGFVYAVRRFMIDYENWGWGRLKFSPSRHLSTPDTPLFRQGVSPRVIDDPVWLKLVWASLNLRQEDLLSEIHYPLSMLQAMAVIWTHAGLRQNELMRLTAGCIIPQSEDINRDDGSTIPAGTLCYLNVPAGKTSKAFVKPVSAAVKKYVDIWLAERPGEQAALTDERTGEKVRFLFQFRGKAVGRDIINRTVIPVLCARAGMPQEDSRGPITSHRGRASAVTALASVPQGMSLYELMQWSGHSSPQSTMHYIRIRPTQLAASFVKADRVAHMMSVLIDHDPDAVSLTGPAIYYDLGDSYCMNPFWSNCPHRMACIGCDFNLPKQSARGLLLESKASVKRYLEEVPLTVDERAVVEGDTEKLEAALRKSGKVLIR